VQTIMADCFVMFCKNDWRSTDEYRERTGIELHFHQFPADKKKRRKSGLHTGTVVPEYSKDNKASQWKVGNSTPSLSKSPEPIVA